MESVRKEIEVGDTKMFLKNIKIFSHSNNRPSLFSSAFLDVSKTGSEC
jgi:hypothetical protein